MNIRTRLINNMPSGAEMTKQVNFGTALGLTNTAKTAQGEVVSTLKSTFTLRGGWFEQSNKFGIKITPARKDKLVAEVKTAADWLEPHEEGRDKTGRGGDLAIPTQEVRRNKRDIISRANRPKGLGPKAFKLMTRRGPVLAQRMKRGSRKGLIILFGLEKTVKIKQRSTFYKPIKHIVDKNLKENIRSGVMKAFATMKIKN